GDASIIGGAKPYLTPPAPADALSQRRAAILRERGRIEHAVRDFLVLLPCLDAKTNHVGVDLDSYIRLGPLLALRFPVANQAAARQHNSISCKIVLHDRPPTNRERHRRTPVHRAEAHPLLRHRKRLDDVARATPAVEKRPQGDRPVTIEPCGNEFLAAGSPQVLLISLHIDVAIVIDLGRNENPLKAGLLVADEPVAQRRRIDVTGLDPLMARPAGVFLPPGSLRNPRRLSAGWPSA